MQVFAYIMCCSRTAGCVQTHACYLVHDVIHPLHPIVLQDSAIEVTGTSKTITKLDVGWLTIGDMKAVRVVYKG